MNQRLILSSALASVLAMGAIAPAAAQDKAKEKCYGIAKAGQNDCKTAENACKGQAVCKGHGFKATTLAECNAAGGKVGE